MSRPRLLERLRRWLGARPRRLFLAGALGTAALCVPALAAAQAPTPPAEPPPAVAHEPVAPEHGATAPAAAGHEAAHGQPAGAGAPHGAPEHGAPGHEGGAAHGDQVHHPEPFNFADIPRFSKEKEAAAKGEKDAHGNVPSPVTPYAYLLINAAILFFIYYRAGKKPVMNALQARREVVSKELDEAAKIKAEAQARLDEYSERLDQLDHELDRIKKELVTAGEADRDRMVKEAEEKADRMRKDATFLLEQELKQVRNELLRHTVEVATAAAESALRGKVAQADQDRLADEYLKQITSMPQTGPGGGAAKEKAS